MKKNIAMFAALALGAFSTNAQASLSVTSSFGYESEYVFRGVQFADAIITPSVDVAYGDFYAGLWFAVPVENSGAYVNEMDLYVGYSKAITSLVTIDVGLTRYAYDNTFTSFLDKDNTLEGFFGVSLDTILSPSLYGYYDFDLQVYTVEAKIGHSITVSDKVSVDLGLSGGYARDDYYDYAFYGVTADLSYAINDSSKFGVGLRYSGSDDYGIYGSATNIKLEKSMFWYGLSFSTGF